MRSLADTARTPTFSVKSIERYVPTTVRSTSLHRPTVPVRPPSTETPGFATVILDAEQCDTGGVTPRKQYLPGCSVVNDSSMGPGAECYVNRFVTVGRSIQVWRPEKPPFTVAGRDYRGSAVGERWLLPRVSVEIGICFDVGGRGRDAGGIAGENSRRGRKALEGPRLLRGLLRRRDGA